MQGTCGSLPSALFPALFVFFCLLAVHTVSAQGISVLEQNRRKAMTHGVSTWLFVEADVSSGGFSFQSPSRTDVTGGRFSFRLSALAGCGEEAVAPRGVSLEETKALKNGS